MGTAENSAGLGVFAFYGERDTFEGRPGEHNNTGIIKELVLRYDGANLVAEEASAGSVTNVAELRAGAKPLRAIVEIDEAFALGGTTPTIDIGTATTEGTNGFAISEAQGEATGVYEITTFAGTWAVELTADTAIGIALGGSSPTVTAAGKLKVVLEYAYMPA